MANAPFVTNPVLTAIAIAYTNNEFIADRVLPRTTVPAREFKWTRYNKEDRFTIPETLVGRKGVPNVVEFGGTEDSAFVLDYGLEDHIPQQDLDNAANMQANFDPRGNAVELLSEVIALGREQRVASLVQDKGNYTHKETLSGTDQWSHADSKPIIQLVDALETPIKRPNLMVISRKASVQLRRNPSVVKAFHGTLADDGLVPMAFVKDLLELDEILVGAAYYNSQRPGHDMQLERVWGNHCSLIYRNPNAQPSKGVTFGFTAEHGGRVAGTRPDGNIGLRGGEAIRVGESLNELIVCPDVAYFIENIIA
ncbi:hypothetical protein GCM10023116_05600 [Kistimonas scapharcae]|uniref:Capsid protein n=2 Tax=Kistimonas scapharcae TaxID=1036133 RepID=A0ABP8UYN2_9GAMM